MITFPTWYSGGFPDTELVVLDLLTPFAKLVTPQITVCTWLPDINALSLPQVGVYRVAGGISDDGQFDHAQLQLDTIAASRADAWAVAEFLRQIMLSYADGGPVRRLDGTTTNVHSVAEVVGPEQIPEINPDSRLVPMRFQVTLTRLRPIPDYQGIRAGLQAAQVI
ncbi:hypothetical protein D5S18_18635 [Nocardia panacis]|uniref:Phage tail protein n=1 Tax=Nocardia panacis TaxID=2340916 RepID=A0A3A4KW47_9NOCA|nr:hypothetical protein [Nocardia panacis]RJO74171.1 hypothetical protein D5S18_18635 [Nocardia panacis]